MGKPALFCSQLGFNFNLEKKDAFFFLLRGKEREEIKQYKKGFFLLLFFFPLVCFTTFALITSLWREIQLPFFSFPFYPSIFLSKGTSGSPYYYSFLVCHTGILLLTPHFRVFFLL